MVNNLLENIIEIIITRCRILQLKCNQFNFSWALPEEPNRTPSVYKLDLGDHTTHHYAVGKGREAKEETEDGREGTPTFSDANDYQYIKDLCENFDQLLEMWLDVVAEPTTVLSPHGHPKI